MEKNKDKKRAARKYFNMEIDKIYHGNCFKISKKFPENSIDMCLTSPPYWNKIDYRIPDQYGLEKDPEEYIKKMSAVFHEIKIILKKKGTLWLNLGDTYGGSCMGLSKSGRNCGPGSILKGKLDKFPMVSHSKGKNDKCLLMIPERLALSLIQDGWILRNKIIWYKPNSMPSSVKDRFSNKWEYIFMFSKNKKYYFDLDSIREQHSPASYSRVKYNSGHSKKYKDEKINHGQPKGTFEHILKIGKNPGDMFNIANESFHGAHFAAFPLKLCEKPIKVGCPKGGIVIDPFCGTGTACLKAKQLGRHYIGIDISKKYCEMAEKKIGKWLF